MEICKYYDSIAAEVMGKDFESILNNDSDREYIASYDFYRYIFESHCFMRDFIYSFESIADYLQEGDLYYWCQEALDIDADSFLGSIIARLKPLELLEYYRKLCDLNRKHGYYNNEVDHLRSLPVLESFIMICVDMSIKHWQIEAENLPEYLKSLEKHRA